MKKTIGFIGLFILLIGIGGCGLFQGKYKPVPKPIKKSFSTVEIETLLQDSTLNVRALEVNKESDFYFSGASSIVGYSYIDGYDSHRFTAFNTYDSLVKQKLEFRSIAETKETIFFMSVANPSYLYRFNKRQLLDIDEKGLPELVYQEKHKKAFYDSMDFWNDKEGIAIGDPTDDCMSVIITRDGGETWTKLSCDVLPKAKEGEAAFAASDTNIAIVGDNTWVATGGKSSRILYSPDKGKTWQVFDTPIIQGLETTGMYSIDFYDEFNGFAIGGDYTKADVNSKNKIRTTDGGKTWSVVSDGVGPGYRSCVQYMPNSNAKALVAIGFKGIDYSNDAGNTWSHLSDEGFYTLRFLNDSIAYAAGNGRISKLTFK